MCAIPSVSRVIRAAAFRAESWAGAPEEESCATATTAKRKQTSAHGKNLCMIDSSEFGRGRSHLVLRIPIWLPKAPHNTPIEGFQRIFSLLRLREGQKALRDWPLPSSQFQNRVINGEKR